MAMEAVGAAASIIAIIELAAKTASFCLEYATAVKNADSDVLRLHDELKSLGNILELVNCEADRIDSMALVPLVYHTINECRSRLIKLEERLGMKKTNKIGHALRINRLKWPLKRKEVDEIIAEVERYKSTLSVALQVHQVICIQDMGDKDVLRKLPYAGEALFDSYSSEWNDTCHEKTRLNVLQQIRDWFHNSHDIPVFWLNGMAGSGKSTICRSVAKEFAAEGLLGASFFFKSRAGDRGNASKFFGTISAQLVQHKSASRFAKKVIASIKRNHNLGSGSIERQFESYIQEPFRMVMGSRFDKSLLIVIDALDECDGENDVRSILRLLGNPLSDLYQDEVKLRILVSSRPEQHIRQAFERLSVGCYQELVLDEITGSVIEHDIELYMTDELSKIASGWPDKIRLKELRNIAGTLFIVAATICRFIRDTRWDPDEQLQAIITRQNIGQTNHFARIYQPIFDRLLFDLSDLQEARLLKEFCDVVGPIIVLADSLSIHGLANLLGISETLIYRRLNPLHSVFKVSSDSDDSVQLLHQTLREFLTSETRRDEKFWIDELEMHKILAEKCLGLLIMTDALKEDICGIGKPVVSRGEISPSIILHYLSPELQYACRFWIQHLWHARYRISDQSQCFHFLQTRILFWIEALGLIGYAYEIKKMLLMLEQIVETTGATKLQTILSDSRTFISTFEDMLDSTPLQLYSSALVFTPKTNVIRQLYAGLIPDWIEHLPAAYDAWDGIAHIPGIHEGEISCIALSPDGQHLATSSKDNTIKVWNLSTMKLEYTLDGAPFPDSSLLFSPNSEYLAAGGCLNKIRLWRCTTGDLLFTISAHKYAIKQIAFSLDSKYLASSAAFDSYVKLWDLQSGTVCRSFSANELPEAYPVSFGFSNDGKMLVCACNGVITLYDMATGSLQHRMKTPETTRYSTESIQLSPNSQLLAVIGYHTFIHVYLTSTGELLHTLERLSQNYLVFSPDSKLLASNSEDMNMIRIWDMENGALLREVEDHSWKHNPICFSKDSSQVFTQSAHATIQLQDLESGDIQARLSHPAKIQTMLLLSDGRKLLSLCLDRFIRYWDIGSEKLEYTIEVGSPVINRLQFSPQGTLLLSLSYREEIAKVWDTKTGKPKYMSDNDTNYSTTPRFSADETITWEDSQEENGRRRMTRSGSIRSFDPLTGKERTVQASESDWEGLGIESASVYAAVPSNKTQQLAVKHHQNKYIHIWCTETGKLLHKLHDKTCATRSGGAGKMVYSFKGDRLVSFKWRSLLMWNTISGSLMYELDFANTIQRSKGLDHKTIFSPDDTLLCVYSSLTELLRIWDTTTRDLLREIRFEGSHLSRLVFSDDMRFLETDRGLIDLKLRQRQDRQEEQSKTIFVSDHWIHVDMEKTLWLPPLYRPTAIDYHSNKLALGYGSGRILIFDTTKSQQSQSKSLLLNGLEYPDLDAK